MISLDGIGIRLIAAMSIVFTTMILIAGACAFGAAIFFTSGGRL